MATTISTYFQPMCRSHLAQPARCLEDEYSYSYSELPVQSRRKQSERCSDWRNARREGEIPLEISVKKTREELAKNAAKNVTNGQKKLIESGWSKVEEVRKKFEAQCSGNSFSRSFESPPRRRLADSLFASFKLPRKREGAMTSQPRSLVAPSVQSKRKSAVELLAETKAFYVKSETVLDRKQELPLRVSSSLGQAIVVGGCVPVSSTTMNNASCCQPYPCASPARAHTAHSQNTHMHGTLGGARRAISASEGLQSTLRRLINHSDSRESVYWQPVYAVPHKLPKSRPIKESYCDSGSRSQHNSGTFSGTSSSGTSGSKNQMRSDPEYSKPKPVGFGDARMFFPDSFVIPRQRPEPIGMGRDKNAYSIPSSSSPENVELPEPPAPSEGEPLTEDEVGAISPPAQYALSTHSRYVRSNSHSQPGRRDEELTNINSHKSLPDLHTHARCYNDNVSTSGAETMGRSPRRRHSTHRTTSCSSKGTRSNRSSLVSSCEAFSEHPSPGDEGYPYNRCGSSFARDSGGSSGHYTQRSAPPPHTPHRTDSPSSGQHSHNRYSSHYAEPQYTCNLPEWHVSAPLQFQDGAPSPPPPPARPCAHYTDTLVGIHFQASAPPPQFQDDSTAAYDGYRESDPCAYGNPKCQTGRNKGQYREYARFRDSDVISKQPQYQDSRRQCRDDAGEYVNTAQLQGEEVTSPLGTFKRQRCLRYKQRRPRPILRSKSDISDSRYRRNEGRSPASAPGDDSSSPGDASPRLHHFFHHLGMDQHSYDSILTEPTSGDSPVFFSDVSTVDSNQLVLGADYTVQGPPQQKLYRNSEPPSVVERNARIIKWLCNCRKLNAS